VKPYKKEGGPRGPPSGETKPGPYKRDCRRWRAARVSSPEPSRISGAGSETGSDEVCWMSVPCPMTLSAARQTTA
jgi:hypothetical protein